MYWILVCCLLVTSFTDARSPVVIVPGTGGSQLEGKLVNKPTKSWYCYKSTSDYFTLWLAISSLSNPLSLNCWIDNFKLEWDTKTKKAKNSKGVLTRTTGWGTTNSIETLDTNGIVPYMKPLIKYLKNLGYTSGKDLRAAPYDFRYTPEHIPDDYHNKLKKLIEDTFNKNGGEKVTLMSHSYGCPVSLYFLSQQTKAWKDKFLKQWITLSGIFGGSGEEVLVYSSGYLEGIPEVLVDRLKIRSEQRTSTSNLFMLPSLKLWNSDPEIAKTKSRSYKLSELDKLLVDVGFPEGVEMRQNVISSYDIMKTSPGVPIHCFYGHIPKSTVEKVIYTDNFPDKPASIIRGSGDGTVNTVSLELCKRFQSQQNEPVDVTVVEGANHNGIFAHSTVLNKLSQLLK